MNLQEQRVEAVRNILIELDTLSDLGVPDSELDKVRREAIFFIYEGGEPMKWDFNRPHSAEARSLHIAFRKADKPFRSGRRYQPIRYDHAIPLATLRHGLRLATATREQMRAFLDHYIQGVVILKEENDRLGDYRLAKSMPIGAAPDDLLDAISPPKSSSSRVISRSSIATCQTEHSGYQRRFSRLRTTRLEPSGSRHIPPGELHEVSAIWRNQSDPERMFEPGCHTVTPRRT